MSLGIEADVHVHFENLRGESLDTLPEWESAWLILTGPWQDLKRLRLEISGQVLPLHWQTDRQVLAALWQKKGPGQYLLRLWHGQLLCLEMPLEVWPTGWGHAGLVALLEDLSYRLPQEWGQALLPGTGSMGGAASHTPLVRGWRQEFARLQECLLDGKEPGLLSALAAWEPNQRLGLPSQQIRVMRPHARRPLFQSALTGQPYVLDQRPNWQENTSENRFVKTLVQHAEKRLRHLSELLQGKNLSKEQAKQLAQLQAWLQALKAQVSRHACWSEIPLQVQPATPLYHLTALPTYRTFWRIWQNLRQAFVFLPDSGSRLRQLENLPWLYQQWTLIHVILAMAQSATAQHWDIAQVQFHFPEPHAMPKPNREWFRLLPRGEQVLELRKGPWAIRVWVERQFGKQGDLQSISYAQRPDLVAVVEKNEQPQQIWIWDAKYRQEENRQRPEKADLDRMHAYRDALRTAQGQKRVKWACILYPGPGELIAPGLAVLQACPLHLRAFEQALKHQIGRLLAGLPN